MGSLQHASSPAKGLEIKISSFYTYISNDFSEKLFFVNIKKLKRKLRSVTCNSVAQSAKGFLVCF